LIAATFTFPAASAGTAVDVSNKEAMFTPFPQGWLLEGLSTSDLCGVPLTPSGGDTRAWAYEAGKSAKRKNREKECENLSNISSRSQAVKLVQRMDEITLYRVKKRKGKGTCPKRGGRKGTWPKGQKSQKEREEWIEQQCMSLIYYNGHGGLNISHQ
jgi:hypothetical protein